MPITCAVIELQDHEGNRTECLYYPNDASEIESLIVFFPGDISDFPFSKRNDPLAVGIFGCMEYGFSLDSIASSICQSCPSRSALLCFRPCTMRGPYSIYDHFVRSDFCGNPLWVQSQRDSCRCLLSYVEDLARKVQQPNLSSCHLSLVGFSKGAVVLSALLRQRDPELLRRVKRFVMIDPGLSIPGRLFPFSDQEYDCFPSEIPIEIFVTSYQMHDPDRPWLQREIADFASKSGARLRSVLTGSKRSLETHFKSITVALSEVFKDSY